MVNQFVNNKYGQIGIAKIIPRVSLQRKTKNLMDALYDQTDAQI